MTFSSCQSMWVFSVLSKSFFFALLYFSVYDILNTHDERCLCGTCSLGRWSLVYEISIFGKKKASGERRFVLYNGFLSSLACGFFPFLEKKGTKLCETQTGTEMPWKIQVSNSPPHGTEMQWRSEILRKSCECI